MRPSSNQAPERWPGRNFGDLIGFKKNIQQGAFFSPIPELVHFFGLNPNIRHVMQGQQWATPNQGQR